MLNVFSISLGCPKNRVDTERLLGGLGVPLRAVKHLKSAGLVFINTCGFIEPAVEESVRVILENAAAIKKLPAGKRPLLAVAGCLVGRFGQKDLADELPEVDLWLPTGRMDEWPLMLGAALRLGAEPCSGRLLSTGPSYAWLKISEGCGQSCSFCTIPFIRGKVKSLDAAFLRAEAESLLSRGVRELVLVAQDLTSWGRDAGSSLPRLLDELLPLEGLERLRLMYLYPSGLTDEFLSYLQKAGPPLLPYFDVPLQHADPDVLKRMGRPFSQSPYKVVERIRKYFPEAALRTSLITGFPGESDAAFAALEDFVIQTRFQNLGVFAYYAEDGTPAATMPDQLPEETRRERRDRIMEIQAEISEELLSAYLGSELDILVDAPHPEWPGLFQGRAWFQAPEVDGVTYVSGLDVKPGDLILAEINETFTYDLNALV